MDDIFPFMFRRRTDEEEKNCDTLGVVVMKVKVKDETLLQFFIDADTFLVDWGDGESTYESFHRYSQEGEYTVRIVGTCLNSLDVSRCYVQSLEIGGCPWLESLNCSGNMLALLDVSACPWLVQLDCSMNGLKQLSLGELPRLRLLDCHVNLLDDLNLSGCPNLLYLYGSANQISELDLSGCSKIRCVDVGINHFKTSELDRFFESLPLLSENKEGRVMCDLNQGYDRHCNLSLLPSKGWRVV